jgi:hypothetical protein
MSLVFLLEKINIAEQLFCTNTHILSKRVRYFHFLWCNSPTWALADSFSMFLNHTHSHGRIPLNEWSARRKGRYLHNTQQIQDTPSQEFEPAIQAIAVSRLRPHGHRIDCLYIKRNKFIFQLHSQIWRPVIASMWLMSHGILTISSPIYGLSQSRFTAQSNRLQISAWRHNILSSYVIFLNFSKEKSVSY